MEADRLRPISVLEVTAHSVADGVAELREVVGFGENRRAERPRDVATFGGFHDNKQDVNHGRAPVERRWPGLSLRRSSHARMKTMMSPQRCGGTSSCHARSAGSRWQLKREARSDTARSGF